MKYTLIILLALQSCNIVWQTRDKPEWDGAVQCASESNINVSNRIQTIPDKV